METTPSPEIGVVSSFRRSEVSFVRWFCWLVFVCWFSFVGSFVGFHSVVSFILLGYHQRGEEIGEVV